MRIEKTKKRKQNREDEEKYLMLRLLRLISFEQDLTSKKIFGMGFERDRLYYFGELPPSRPITFGYQKHYPPYPSDQVWRLEMIGRNGAFHNRLSKECICTVKDFVAILHINSEWLKEILGPKMYPKLWDTVVNHAMTFKSDTSVCFSYTPNFQQETTVVFNIMGQLMGLIVERTFITVDELSETEKADAHKLVVSASEHWNEVKSVDNLTISLMSGSNLTMMECATGRNFETNDIDLYVNTQPATSSTSIMSPGGTTGVGNLDNTSGQPSSFQYADSMIWEPFDIFSSEPFFHFDDIDIYGNTQPSEPLFHSDDIDIYGNTQPDTSSASIRNLDHTSGQPSFFQGANYLPEAPPPISE